MLSGPFHKFQCRGGMECQIHSVQLSAALYSKKWLSGRKRARGADVKSKKVV